MASLPYEIAKLIKEPGNRLCADCQAPLTTPPNTYASLRYGVWLCSSCADIHATELPSANILKKAQEDWSAGEIKVMQDAKSNLAVNKILERYVPSGWEKISAISSVDEKKHWIKAKYFSHYFTVPQTSVDGLNKIEKTNRKKRIIADTTLPTRIVDYFLILGPGKAKLTPEGNPPPDSTPSSPQKKIDNLEQVEFKVDIIDSYPDKKNHYHDTPIPELVGPMIFPSGLTLSRNERAPFSFSFVLTDINRVKLYGMTLIIYEIMDPDVLCYLLGSKYTAHDIKRLTSGMVYYAPKALTILSHYGFFQLFSKFLQQIYHVSLSSSPLPLERYIVNFMKELPLPPPGRTEILFSLPQIQLSITRPPPNQLPMVDFSFRPVFTCLSVDNILTVFTCLCQEMTVCFTSRNIALLTPVQEAFLSFMFPFVWQGCYVPILPVNMIEMLDAPVPLLCGMNQADLEKMMEEEDIALANVIFVNLDNDSVVYGIGEENPLDEPKRPILPLPKSKVGKLKSKLEEFGGIIYHTDMVQVMKAGHPFSNNEHLVPMKNFIFEQGVISTTAQHHRSSFFSSAKAMTKSQFKLGIRKTLNNNAAANIANGSNASTSPNHPRVSNAGIAASGGKYQAIAESEALPFKHPAACTLVTSSNARQNTSNSINLLDAENNYIAGQTFNAKEIREAFLRFFVASFIDYEDYFVDITKKEKEGSNGRGNSNEPSSSGKRGSIPLEECEFDKKGFANHLQDEFLAHMVESQMFSNFKSEKVDSKNVSMEIRFFDENILAKKNRSKLQLIKSSTPFLSDTKDYLREIYTAPLPSTFGIAENTNYTYPSFPSKLNSTQFGQSIRTAVVLVETPEKRRFQDDQASNYLLNIISATTASDFQSLKKMNKQISDKIKIGSQGSSKRTHLLQEQEGFHSPGKTAALRGVEVKNRYRSLTRGMSSLLVKNGSEDIDESDENLPRDSNIDIPRSTSMPVIGGVNPLSPTALKLHATMEENKFFQLTRQYYYFIMNMIVMIQSNYRRRKVFDYYQRLKRSSCRVQIYYRYYRTRKMKKNVKFMISVKKIQTVYRCYRWYRRYHMIRWLIIRIQSFRRQQRLRRQFLAIKAKVLLIQAIIRGWLKRKKFHNQLREWIVQRREQISLLWMLERTSLYYRALFWKVMNHLSDYLSPSNPRPSSLQGNESKKGREKERKKLLLSCLVLGFYDEECRRLYESLGLAVKDSPCFSSASFHTLSFQEQFERVNQLPIIRKLQDLTKAFTLVPATDTTAGTATVVKNDANQVKETVVQIDEYLASAFQRSAEWARVYTLSVEQEKKDRELLYSIFQQYEKDGAANTSSSGKKVEDYFNFFQIEKRKRRKRKMTQYIFMNGLSEEYNEVSCTVLLSLLAYHHRKTSSSTASNASSSMTSFQREQLSLTKTMSLEYKVIESDWLAMKKQQLLTKHCLEVIKACLLSMERLRRNQQQQQLARREIYYQVPQVPPLSISPASSVRSSPQRPHHLSNHRK